MKKILLTILAVLAMSGMAMAQTAPSDINLHRNEDGSWSFIMPGRNLVMSIETFSTNDTVNGHYLAGVPEGWLILALGDTVPVSNDSLRRTTPITEGTPVTIVPTGNLRAIKSITLIDVPLPAGVIAGLFSVSATQQVYFSQGNLQATTTDSGSTWTWSFATNQYDYVGNAVANNAINGNGTVSTNGTVDLFGWSTASNSNGIHNSSSSSVYSGDFVDWGNNAIANGGNTVNSGWRTLTKDEWVYLFSTRTDAASKYGHGKVNGVNGVIILPDEWTLPSGLSFTAGNTNWGNVYTLEQWAQMEAGGAVFLPAEGSRTGASFSNVGSRGYYRTSTASDWEEAYTLYFRYELVEPQNNAYRYRGYCVRLVRDNN